MGELIELPTRLLQPIMFPWIDQDHENLDEIVAELAKKNIKPTFHQTVYPLLETLLTRKMRLIVLNMSAISGEYDNNEELDKILEQISGGEDFWKVGRYVIQQLRTPNSANRNTTIFATSYNTDVFDKSTKQHYVVKDIAVKAGATQFYDLICCHELLRRDILSHFRK